MPLLSSGNREVGGMGADAESMGLLCRVKENLVVGLGEGGSPHRSLKSGVGFPENGLWQLALGEVGRMKDLDETLNLEKELDWETGRSRVLTLESCDSFLC